MLDLNPDTETYILFFLGFFFILGTLGLGTTPIMGLLIILGGLYRFYFTTEKNLDYNNLYQTGLKEYNAGNYKKAGGLLYQSLNINQKNHKAWNALGIICTKLGYFDNGTKCYHEALNLDPANKIVLKNLQFNEKKKSSNPSSNNVSREISDDLDLITNTQSKYEIIKEFLLKPKEGFRRIRSIDWKENFNLIIPLILIYSVLLAFTLSKGNSPFTFLIMVSNIFGLLIGIPIISAVIHIGILIFGKGSNMGFNRTFNISCYSYIPNLLLGWIPFIGWFIGGLWTFYLFTLGLKEIHNLSTIRALLSLSILFVIIVVIMVNVVFSSTTL